MLRTLMVFRCPCAAGDTIGWEGAEQPWAGSGSLSDAASRGGCSNSSCHSRRRRTGYRCYRWRGPTWLAAVTGAAGTIGSSGLLTGGGYGPLLPRFGLALDTLLGAEIVLADGQIVFADSSQNSELFWAIRGGGGNFGVVTSLLVRLHPIEKVLAGFILFPLAEAPRY